VTRIAVLGGGQLGRMLGLAGIPLDVSFSFLDPVANAPASAVGELVVGELSDRDAAREAARAADVVTYEWEGVPAGTTRALMGDGHDVFPPSDALEASQDRLAEKVAFGSVGIGCAPFRPVSDRDSLLAAVDALGLPAVLKTRRGGYDGKGQAVLREPADVDGAWDALGEQALILEALIPFTRELSIIAVRGRDGETACWPVVENVHRDGILRVSRAPARGWNDALQARAEACVTPLLERFDYVGVCCVELFDVEGDLLANEMAPRVHNSGHWTIEGARTSQFENHVRAVLGLPLGDTGAREPAAMVNCIGTMPAAKSVLAVPGAHLHDYGKGPRPGRKLGHVTITAPDCEQLEARIAEVEPLVDDAT
jgi:5-(carboxyamino)imidazole ribonucleotide synthase